MMNFCNVMTQHLSMLRGNDLDVPNKSLQTVCLGTTGPVIYSFISSNSPLSPVTALFIMAIVNIGVAYYTQDAKEKQIQLQQKLQAARQEEEEKAKNFNLMKEKVERAVVDQLRNFPWALDKTDAEIIASVEDSISPDYLKVLTWDCQKVSNEDTINKVVQEKLIKGFGYFIRNIEWLNKKRNEMIQEARHFHPQWSEKTDAEIVSLLKKDNYIETYSKEFKTKHVEFLEKQINRANSDLEKRIKIGKEARGFLNLMLAKFEKEKQARLGLLE